MSWHEVRTRCRQAVGKRWDIARANLGLSINCQAQSSGVQKSARFFFEAESVPRLVALLHERLPRQADEIIRQAEQICLHRFDLLGYERLDHGPEIDWHIDPVHGKRAPLKPWFRVRYLDFEEAGDAKVIWELNRHQHLVTLAKAYLLSGEERFFREILRQWFHWRQENPYPMGINWGSSLEVAFRALAWIWLRYLLANSPLASDFSTDLDGALAICGRHLERYLSTYFSPNTHLLGEGVALFFIGTLCPSLAAAERWQRQGWELVVRQAERQVQADGVHVEQSMYYHVYALDFFLHARQLAAVNQIPIPSQFDRTLENMLEFLCDLCQAAPPPRFGDDDGGRVFDPRRNRSEHLLDPLATGAVVFGRPDFKAVARLLPEETIWLLGGEGVEEFERIPEATPLTVSRRFPSSGIHVMASSQPISCRLTLQAGPLGFQAAGHGHASALSLHLAVNGQEWLLDPGTYVYISPGSERDMFRGTGAHNTLRVDGANQAEPVTPFAWGKQPQVHTEHWVAGHSFDFVAARHDGYARLLWPVIHRREVFHLKSRLWLVLDRAVGEGFHQLELFWHLAPQLTLDKKSQHSIRFASAGEYAFGVLTAAGHQWTRELGEGSWSPVYGRKERCSTLCFGIGAQLPAEFATLLLAVPKHVTELGEFTSLKGKAGDNSLSGYLYRVAQESHWIFFAESGKHWQCAPWVSDARLVYCKSNSEGQIEHIALCDGSFVEVAGRRVFAARQRVNWWEMLDVCGSRRVFTSNGESGLAHPKAALAEEEPLEPVYVQPDLQRGV